MFNSFFYQPHLLFVWSLSFFSSKFIFHQNKQETKSLIIAHRLLIKILMYAKDLSKFLQDFFM